MDLKEVISQLQDLIRDRESLLTKDIENDNIFLKDKQALEIAIELLQKNNQREYIIFILGYDLLQNLFSFSCKPEADFVYKKCNKLADMFLESRYNVDTKPLYDCLENFADTIRICTICGEIMQEGYLLNGGEKYYCSDNCLHTDYTDKEWEDLYDEDGDSYWTQWN